ncbi:hypothetical protein [Erythrobacter rubeus]|uniref:DUF4124 domain-containing protein n=1 Tax=Erythrobacter rubeus TaxID=2760803 RepID=A0ABR8KXR7_9SPHN|nr:hypothetical protein [Erythrobacter rubeus]MBD2842956.1 hypothetical protein [Erythrobacter rubeus]
MLQNLSLEMWLVLIAGVNILSCLSGEIYSAWRVGKQLEAIEAEQVAGGSSFILKKVAKKAPSRQSAPAQLPDHEGDRHGRRTGWQAETGIRESGDPHWQPQSSRKRGNGRFETGIDETYDHYAAEAERAQAQALDRYRGSIRTREIEATQIACTVVYDDTAPRFEVPAKRDRAPREPGANSKVQLESAAVF